LVHFRSAKNSKNYFKKSAVKSYLKVIEAILASHDFFHTKSAKNSAGATSCPKTAWELIKLDEIIRSQI